MALGTTVAIVVAAVVLFVLFIRNHRQRARMDALLTQLGWVRERDGESTMVRSDHDDWTVCVTRSFVTQQPTPTTHIVVSTWSSPWPRLAAGTILAGPTPPGPLRELAVELLSTISERIGGWLGLAKVSGGVRLRPLESTDARLLVLVTDAAPTLRLTALADAIDAWCTRYAAERDQPAVVFDSDGVTVRIRSDALITPGRLTDFVELGIASRMALDNASR